MNDRRRIHICYDGREKTLCGRPVKHMNQAFITADCKSCIRALNSKLKKRGERKNASSNDERGRAPENEGLPEVAEVPATAADPGE
jgi:hypothetical protein